MTKKRNQKGLDIAVLLITVAVVFLVNYIGSFWFGRLDLTSEKRYSLSEATRSQVTELEDVVFVKVYLEGDLPAALKRLQQSVKEILDEYRAYSNGNFEYEFVNPAISENEEENKQVFDQLLEKGLLYTNLEFQEGDISSKKIIFPGAIFSYREQEIPLQILPPQNTNDPLIEINRAINQLEYNISSTIKKLTREKRQTISFLQGHGELTGIEVADISRVLGDFYNLRADTIEGRLDALENLDGLIIAGPDSSFTDKDKFILDQFVMNGGRIMWLVDPVAISMDSLRDKRYTMSLPKQVRVEDMLFRYGVRLNTNLLMDMQCLTIPVDVSPVPEQPNYKPKPWFYYPLLTPAANHPIVTSIGPVKSEFVSSIDTLKTSVDVRKTVLLTTSKYTKVINSPSRVSLNILRNRPDERQFAGPARAAAVLLEGEFESAFAKLLPPEMYNIEGLKIKEKSVPNRMIVVADADIIRNPVNQARQQFFPLGYDRFSRQTFSNRDFLYNAINYLFEDEELIETRSKDFEIRLLDENRIQTERTFWQVANFGVPIVLVVLFGLSWYAVRRRKYAS